MHVYVPLGEGVLILDVPEYPAIVLLSERCLRSSEPEFERHLEPPDPVMDIFLKEGEEEEGLCLGRSTVDGEKRRLDTGAADM